MSLSPGLHEGLAVHGPEPSVVTVELHPNDEGTRLVLTHERLPEDVVESHRGGWGAMLDLLAGILVESRET